MYLRVDSRRKIPVTILLRAIGMSEEEILETFTTRCPVRMEQWREVPLPLLEGAKPIFPLVDAGKGDVVLDKGKKVTPTAITKLAQAEVESVLAPQEFLQDLLTSGGEDDAYVFDANGWQVRPASLVGKKLPLTLLHEDRIAVKAGTKLTAARAGKLPELCAISLPLRSRFFIGVENFQRQKLSFDIRAEKAGVEVRAGRNPHADPCEEAAGCGAEGNRGSGFVLLRSRAGARPVRS